MHMTVLAIQPVYVAIGGPLLAIYRLKHSLQSELQSHHKLYLTYCQIHRLYSYIRSYILQFSQVLHMPRVLCHVHAWY